MRLIIFIDRQAAELSVSQGFRIIEFVGFDRPIAHRCNALLRDFFFEDPDRILEVIGIANLIACTKNKQLFCPQKKYCLADHKSLPSRSVARQYSRWNSQ